MRNNIKKDLSLTKIYSIVMGLIAIILLIVGVIIKRNLIISITATILLLHSMLLFFQVTIATKTKYSAIYEETLDERNRLVQVKSSAMSAKLSQILIICTLIVGQFVNISFNVGMIIILILGAIGNYFSYAYYQRKL